MMTETLLRLPDVMAVTGLSKSTLYDMQRAQKFPQSIRLTRRCVAWKESAIQAFISSRELNANNGGPGHEQQ